MSVDEPIDETKKLYMRVKSLEKTVKPIPSDVEKITKQTITLYRDVRHIESTIRRFEGLTTIGVGIPKFGPIAAFAMVVIQMVNIILEKGQQETRERMEKEIEIRTQKMRMELLETVEADLEQRKRYTFRRTNPA